MTDFTDGADGRTKQITSILRSLYQVKCCQGKNNKHTHFIFGAFTGSICTPIEGIIFFFSS